MIPNVSGALFAVHFREGGRGHFDDSPCMMDSTIYEAARNQAAAQLVQVEAQRKLDAAKLKRRRSPGPPNSFSQQKDNPNESKILQNRADLDVAKAALEWADINLEDCSITAPADGRTRKHSFDFGKVR
jgi:multidrug resistance efflux pump